MLDKRGKNNPNFKHGKYIENRCLCGNLMAPKSKCCQECYLKYNIGKNNNNYKDGRTLKEYFCIVCGEKITHFSGIYGSGKCKTHGSKQGRHYYCIDCKINEISYNTFHYGKKRCQKCNGKEQSKRIKGKNNPNWIDSRSLKEYHCKYCPLKISWKTFIRGKGCCPSHARIGVKISKETRLKISRRMKGKNHPNFGKRGKQAFGYINGRAYELYPEVFFKIKDSIRKRDNYECQNCSMTEEEHLIVRGRVLDVHHIDYNKQNCEDNNLISLCNQCNIRANGNRDYWIEHYKSIMEKISCPKNV